MPKMKKPPHNAYYYFMLDRKAKYEEMGHRFCGGMKDVAEAVRDEWRELPQNEKDYFGNLAKQGREQEKHNLHNKFTVTGESFAQLQQREAADKVEREKLEKYIDDLTITSQTPTETRNFIFIKTIHSALQHNEDRYWPLELALAVFNLKDGMKCNYATLIDTKISPFGFASTVKETSEETALPVPGAPAFGPSHSDYRKILTNIKKFIEKFLEEYPQEYVLFAMESELKPAEGCLKWLFEETVLEDDELPVWKNFFKNLKFYKLPRLILRFAYLAKARNPEYSNVMVMYPDLEQAAITVLSESCFDYRDDITCPYHRQEEHSYKMNLCCRNIVLRRIYLLLNHMVPAMKLPKKDGHEIERFMLKSSSCRPLLKGEQAAQAPVLIPPKQEVKKEAKEKKLVVEKPYVPLHEPNAEGISSDEEVEEKPKGNLGNSRMDVDEENEDEDADIISGFTVGAAANNPQIPWGMKREVEPAQFAEDDFPSLSSTMSSSRSFSAGLGRGRGRGHSKQDSDSDDEFLPRSSAVGRGRGGF